VISGRVQKTKPRLLRGLFVSIGQTIELIDDLGGYKPERVIVTRRSKDRWEVTRINHGSSPNFKKGGGEK
jgi:hypothetical protein